MESRMRRAVEVSPEQIANVNAQFERAMRRVSAGVKCHMPESPPKARQRRGKRPAPNLSHVRPPSVPTLLAALRVLGVTYESVIEKNMRPAMWRTRALIYIALRRHGYSFPRIAIWMHRSDHTTVLKVARKWEAKLTAEDVAVLDEIKGQVS